MALIKCPECGKEISDMARSCPNCGRPLQPIGQNNVQNPNLQQEMNGSPQIRNQNAAPSQKPKKKGHGCLITLLVFIAIIVLMAIISVMVAVLANTQKNSEGTNNNPIGTEKSQDDEYGRDVAFGQEGDIAEGLVLIVNEIAETDSISAANGLLAYKPDSGKFAVINVTISNNSKKSQSLLLNYFRLVGPDDAKYVATIITAADDKFITVDTVNPNLDVTGNLVFEIPKELSVEECLLQYSDYDLFNKISYFKLK